MKFCLMVKPVSTPLDLKRANITLTLDIYGHVLPDMQKAAAERLERRVFLLTGTLWSHKEEKGDHVIALFFFDFIDGQGRSRTADTRIFSPCINVSPRCNLT
jgi:hypothetical protein